MKTEEEAGRLLCPKKLDNQDESDRFCEASACMMWVWTDKNMNDDEGMLTGDCGLIFPSFITVGDITRSTR